MLICQYLSKLKCIFGLLIPVLEAEYSHIYMPEFVSIFFVTYCYRETKNFIWGLGKYIIVNS